MDIEPTTKTPSLSSNERYEWPVHQPTWKGIKIHRNWFTSKESEHSQCNGQAKALQNAKVQLKNDQNPLSFLMKFFY